MSGIIFKLRNLRGLQRREMVVLKELAIFADEEGLAWPRNQVLSRNAGYSVRSIQEALDVLQDLDLIEIRRKGHLNDRGELVVTIRIIKLLPDNWGPYLWEASEDDEGGILEISDKEAAQRNIKFVGGGNKATYA